MSHILILGGDGYLGWPTAMYFSARGHQVTVVDSYFRRNACVEVDSSPLYQVPNLKERAQIWHEKTGCEIKVVVGDLAEPSVMRSLFDGVHLGYHWAIDQKFTGCPEVVIHYAEQPSAPYSVMDAVHADFTLVNNLRVTNNLMWSVKEFDPSIHIIKLGTMGEYGTPNIDIEEGWLDINHNGRKDKFLYPRQASSLYHTSKIMDTDLLWFGVRMWNLRVTDLMQGPVYGITTSESIIDDRLNTIFNYDDIFGTVINRFIVQAIVGVPLTVYGKGGQTRGYLNIKDTLQCVDLAYKKPVNQGELRILNQFTEQFTVNELAAKVVEAGSYLGISVSTKRIDNPRKEQEEHYYNAKHSGLVEMGLKPHFLTVETLADLMDRVMRYKQDVKRSLIMPRVGW